MIDYSRVGYRIKICRRLADMTREELAEKAGVDYFTVCAIERGTCEKYESIDAVCRVFDMETDYVLDPSNKAAENKAWSNMSPEEVEKANAFIEKYIKYGGLTK